LRVGKLFGNYFELQDTHNVLLYIMENQLYLDTPSLAVWFPSEIYPQIRNKIKHLPEPDYGAHTSPNNPLSSKPILATASVIVNPKDFNIITYKNLLLILNVMKILQDAIK